MKRKIGIILSIIIVSSFNGCVKSEDGQDISSKKGLFLEDNLSENKKDIEMELNSKELELEEIQNEIIRFHVLANSDTEEDQKLKIKVRDKVIEKMSSKLSNTKNINEAREILIDSIDEVDRIAKDVIEENGYNYNVRSELKRENFPDKIYGDTLYPQGEYEAFRILIGEAEGQNWWCVMFPPLCFVDESKQTINSDKSEENFEEIRNESKDTENNKSKNKEKIKFKSKLFELFKKK